MTRGLNATEIMADINEWLMGAAITQKLADNVSDALDVAVGSPNEKNNSALVDSYVTARDRAKEFLGV